MKRTTKTLAVMLVLIMLLSLGTASLAAAYGAQGTGGNTLTMLTPSDIAVKSTDGAYISNIINTPFDPASDVTFKFTMSSGMNNFNEASFKSGNLLLISVSASYGGASAATVTYVSGDSTGVTISAGKLAEGAYVLVFGKGIQGNNSSKTLGTDIAFEFTVKGNSAPAESPFTDVPDWAKAYVAAVAENGCMKGLTETTFGPDTVMTRGEFVTVLGMARGIKTANYATSAFTDVAATDACSPYAAWAASKNIVTGYGDGIFGPNDVLTRAMVVTMLYRYAVAFSLDTTAEASLSSFTDSAQVGDWAATAMSWAIGKGYIAGVGDNTLAPNMDITRVMTAKLISVIILEK
jgi:hypothetical protein